MEEAAEEFEGQFTCLGQNTAKYITIHKSHILQITKCKNKYNNNKKNANRVELNTKIAAALKII